jgi:hypothetical protein
VRAFVGVGGAGRSSSREAQIVPAEGDIGLIGAAGGRRADKPLKQWWRDAAYLWDA